MKYDVWKTKDGRAIPVSDMTSEHLLNVIAAIESGRCYGPSEPGFDCGDVENGLGLPIWPPERKNWLTVLHAEALKRGLDASRAGTKRVGIIDFIFREWENRWGPDIEITTYDLAKWAKSFLSKYGVEEPELDVSNLTGRVTYLHWKKGGTPLE